MESGNQGATMAIDTATYVEVLEAEVVAKTQEILRLRAVISTFIAGAAQTDERGELHTEPTQ